MFWEIKKVDLSLKTIVYEKGNDLRKYFENTSRNYGFECVQVEYGDDSLFSYFSQNKVDILVLNDDGFDHERLCFLLDIIYNNYCKHILIVTNNTFDNQNFDCINGLNSPNFDLILGSSLLKIKKKIDSLPQHNLPLIKSKICEQLFKYKFSSRYDGFAYYTDAILRAYLTYPYGYSIMEIYKEVGEKYNKSAYAVEKSMRTALLSALEQIRSMPTTVENMRLRSEFQYNMTNTIAISTIVNKLKIDKEISAELEVENC